MKKLRTLVLVMLATIEEEPVNEPDFAGTKYTVTPRHEPVLIEPSDLDFQQLREVDRERIHSAFKTELQAQIARDLDLARRRYHEGNIWG